MKIFLLNRTFLKVLIGSIDLFPKKKFLDFLFAFFYFHNFLWRNFFNKIKYLKTLKGF